MSSGGGTPKPSLRVFRCRRPILRLPRGLRTLLGLSWRLRTSQALRRAHRCRGRARPERAPGRGRTASSAPTAPARRRRLRMLRGSTRFSAGQTAIRRGRREDSPGPRPTISSPTPTPHPSGRDKLRRPRPLRGRSRGADRAGARGSRLGSSRAGDTVGTHRRHEAKKKGSRAPRQATIKRTPHIRPVWPGCARSIRSPGVVPAPCTLEPSHEARVEQASLADGAAASSARAGSSARGLVDDLRGREGRGSARRSRGPGGAGSPVGAGRRRGRPRGRRPPHRC